jgi:NADH:ubiquinone oxidoreductase subunit 4 (subunit M)
MLLGIVILGVYPNLLFSLTNPAVEHISRVFAG